MAAAVLYHTRAAGFQLITHSILRSRQMNNTQALASPSRLITHLMRTSRRALASVAFRLITHSILMTRQMYNTQA